MILALVISLVMLFLVLAFWRSDRWAWDAERQLLLDRIQARTPADMHSLALARNLLTPRKEEEPEEKDGPPPITMAGTDPSEYERLAELESVAQAGRTRWLD